MEREIIKGTAEILKGILENQSIKISFEQAAGGDVTVLIFGNQGKVTLNKLIKSIAEGLKGTLELN
ncbi:MAG: hypothetical protein N2645_22765 [Clostridia bacterium]|nr:hypothetical protein [Clostridia bacterium]